jgi:L-ascorbate metabolism protein UlaG (beta-lactamase superfamily)
VLKEKPSIRVGYCKGCFDFIGKNFDRYEPDKTYNYGRFQITPFMLFHNVPNCGYKIQGLGKKIFHSTDTGCLFEIEAKGFDLYCIESNYDETTVYDVIEKLEAEGKFAHQRNSIKNHLSEQQMNEFYLQNKGDNSQLVRLHESESKLKPE